MWKLTIQLYLLCIILFSSCATGVKALEAPKDESLLLKTYIKMAKENKDSLHWENIRNFSKPGFRFSYLRLFLSAKVNGRTKLLNSIDAGPFFVVDLQLSNENIKEIRDFAFLEPIFDSSTKRDFWDYKEACERIAERVIKDIGWYNECQVFLKDQPMGGYYMAIASVENASISLSEFKFLTNGEKGKIDIKYGWK